MASLTEGKVTPMLTQLLESLKDEKKVSLAVSDAKLGTAINKLPQFNITPVVESQTVELYRNIRAHLSDLIPGLKAENLRSLALGLSHSLSRHKLRFSPDKVDVMIVQAISLLDDLDKELNTYAMRVKEWYGWHFPELGKILNDNLAYARVIIAVGLRTNTHSTDLSDILPEEIETAVKAAAEVSMGTEITEEDLLNITMLAEHVVRYTETRLQLSSYLEARMRAIAPNLTELVGTLVGARLIAHAGSLMSLAKAPGSTIQILGAEKALFRALKTKHATPKYGLIYHSSLVGQASGKNKGKIARSLAAKTALGVRADALSDWIDENGDEADEEERAAFGVASRAKIEHNLRKLEGKPLLPKGVNVDPNGVPLGAPSKFDIKEARKYNIDADGLTGDEPAALESEAEAAPTPKKDKKDKKEKKSKKEKKALIEEVSDEEMEDAPATNGTNGTGIVPSSPTLSSVSEDSDDLPPSIFPLEEQQWHSAIEGATRKAKNARKKERHQRNEELAPERAAARKARKEQQQRRIKREERRRAKLEQDLRRAARTAAPGLPPQTPAKTSTTPIATPAAKKLSEADYEKYAEAAGISVSKFKRKFERGDVELAADGTPKVLSKKDAKKSSKKADKEEGGKRKRDEGGEEKPKKKKKKADA